MTQHCQSLPSPTPQTTDKIIPNDTFFFAFSSYLLKPIASLRDPPDKINTVHHCIVYRLHSSHHSRHIAASTRSLQARWSNSVKLFLPFQTIGTHLFTIWEQRRKKRNYFCWEAYIKWLLVVGSKIKVLIETPPSSAWALSSPVACLLYRASI